ncbi:MAG: hypothetical protein R3C11_27170 [Planctomycetaceae bacterium]
MTDHSDASATLRGFRNQFLYVLHRILRDEEADKRIYRPEGAEDLAVYDAKQTLIESSQIKDYSSGLALSHFGPKKKNGFISRYYRRLSSHPHTVTRIVSYGPLGPELEGAIRGNKQDNDPKHRISVVKKICESNSSISNADAARMLDGLQGNIEHPDSQALRDEVLSVLEGTIAGGHAESTLELLMYWIFDASEYQKDVTKQGLLVQIEVIGEYLAALSSSVIEWGISVSPVKNEALSTEEKEKLVYEYQLGIQAGWKHILANADCPRPDRLKELHSKLRKHSAVILRGASGQGKSTLGWRYLYEYGAEGMRFHVKLVEGREHALRIANAIKAHVKKLRLDVIVYIDVAPHDSGWEELARGLIDAGLKVLVTIREEDFRRSSIDVSKFDYAEVVLEGVTIEEARPIYESLRFLNTDTLDFEDVWGQFTANDDGPLMEFTHLITQGETLESKIQSQVKRLRHDVNSSQGQVSNAHLHLLAIAAIANSAEARVDYLALCSEIGLDPISKPLDVLEHEYLLPIHIDGHQTLVKGLHSLRSLALEQALVPDEQWVDYAIRALGVVADDDIERFLLCLFSRHPKESDAIESSVRELSLRSWSHAGGIGRALIWLGLSRYEQVNSQIIQSAINQYGELWRFCCDVFVGFEGDEAHESFRNSLSSGADNIPRIDTTPKSEVFTPFINWASNANHPPKPVSDSDWYGAGDVAYWIGRHHVQCNLQDSLTEVLPDIFEERTSLNAIAAFISGVSKLKTKRFTEWHNSISASLKQKFTARSDSIDVVEDDEQISVFFTVALENETLAASGDLISEKNKTTGDWHSQTMSRIQLIRDLFPAKKFYASQGIGHEPFMSEVSPDETTKRIPVDNLPESRAVQLNATFIGLVNYRHNRLNSWHEYSAQILDYRKSVQVIFRKLHRTWEGLLSAASVKQSVLNQFPKTELRTFATKLPMLPQKAIDEWGFASEGRSEKSREENSETILRRFSQWRKASRQYAHGIENMFLRVARQTNKLVRFKTGNKTQDPEKDAHYIVVNLAESWKALKLMQSEYRKHFARFHSPVVLNNIEQHEQINWRHLWAAAIAIRHGMTKSGKVVESEISQFRQQFLDKLQEKVAKVIEGFASVEVIQDPWTLDDVDHLRIVCNHDSVKTIDSSITAIIEAIWRGCHFRNWNEFEWKPIEVEWNKIAIVHQVRGHSLHPSMGLLHTNTLFFYSDNFEVQSFHRALLPIDKSSFLNGGFSLWDTPLLNATYALHESIQIIGAIMLRLEPLWNVLTIDPQAETIEKEITKYFNELNSAILAVRQDKTVLELLLQLDGSNYAIQIIDMLDHVGDFPFSESDMSDFDETPEKLNNWLDVVKVIPQEYDRILLEIMEYSTRGQ